MLTWSGVALAFVALLALIAQRSFDWWWADAIGGLAIALLLAQQGSRVIRERGLAD
jgi:divalent metal cation (Fe/Co/Zn/Cd) transporter